MIDGYAEANVEDNVVDLVVRGKNQGWGAPNLSVKALVWSGTNEDEFSWDMSSMEPLGYFELNERISLEQDRTPHRIDVELDWDTGRHFYTAWDSSVTASRIPIINHAVFRSTFGVDGVGCRFVDFSPHVGILYQVDAQEVK